MGVRISNVNACAHLHVYTRFRLAQIFASLAWTLRCGGSKVMVKATGQGEVVASASLYAQAPTSAPCSSAIKLSRASRTYFELNVLLELDAQQMRSR